MINPDAKHPCIYDDDNVTLYLEMCGDKPFIHCRVVNWSHNKLKEFLQIWLDIASIFKKKGYEYIYAPDMEPKVTKFAKVFGFKETQDSILSEDNKIRGVLIWKL